MRVTFLGSVVLVAFFVIGVESHGRLIEPPSRGSMWRYGFDTPRDYNDHECYCGGSGRQWDRNKGKCGICGDPWDSPQVHFFIFLLQYNCTAIVFDVLYSQRCCE